MWIFKWINEPISFYIVDPIVVKIIKQNENKLLLAFKYMNNNSSSLYFYTKKEEILLIARIGWYNMILSYHIDIAKQDSSMCGVLPNTFIMRILTFNYILLGATKIFFMQDTRLWSFFWMLYMNVSNKSLVYIYPNMFYF